MRAKPKRHLKRIVLAALREHRALTTGEIAREASFWPIKDVHPYLRRLERQKLVRSARPGRVLVWYLTQKGLERVRWFDLHPHYPVWIKRQRVEQ
jgi:hypothetical protein